jgi:hypothetical protein
MGHDSLLPELVQLATVLSQSMPDSPPLVAVLCILAFQSPDIIREVFAGLRRGKKRR